MGRVGLFFPEAAFMNKVLQLESFMQALAEALQDLSAESDETCSRQRCSGKCCCIPQRTQTQCPGVKPWFYTRVSLGNYRPSDVKVKMENDCVIIHARREERHGEDFDITETRRQIKLPKGVDGERVSCFLGPDGRMLIKVAPTAVKQARECPETKPKSGESGPGDKAEGVDASGAINFEATSTPKTSLAVTFTVKREDEPAKAVYSHNASLPAVKESFEEKRDEDTDEDIAAIESGADSIISSEVVRHQTSPLLSEDIAVIDDQSIKIDDDNEQGTRPVQTNLVGQSEDDYNRDVDEELNPLSESVRIIEEKGKKNFEVSLSLKDFDAEICPSNL